MSNAEAKKLKELLISAVSSAPKPVPMSTMSPVYASGGSFTAYPVHGTGIVEEEIDPLAPTDLEERT